VTRVQGDCRSSGVQDREGGDEFGFLNGRKKCRSTLPLSARRPILSGIFIPAMPIQGKKSVSLRATLQTSKFQKIKKGKKKKNLRLISS
jgi:hypothetical protein